MEEFLQQLQNLDWLELLKDVLLFVLVYLTRGKNAAKTATAEEKAQKKHQKNLKKLKEKNEKLAAELQEGLAEQAKLEKEEAANAGSM